MGIFLGCLLKLPWRPELGIQRYIWTSPQPVSSLVPVNIGLYDGLCEGNQDELSFPTAESIQKYIASKADWSQEIKQARILLALVYSTFVLAWAVTAAPRIEIVDNDGYLLQSKIGVLLGR